MNTNTNTNTNILEIGGGHSAATQAEQLAPKPLTIEATGLSRSFLADLVSKHLLTGRSATISELSSRCALSGGIIEDILHGLREESRAEVLGRSEASNSLRYTLSERGRSLAYEALQRSSYIGPAPVPLKEYARVVRAQSVHGRDVTQEMVDELYSNVVISDQIRETLGLSMNSGKAIFVYGPAGTGKTYLTSMLPRLFKDDVLVPHAICVNESVVPVFDPLVHRALASDRSPSLMLGEGFDERFVRSERPVVITGGELVSEMLDVQYDSATREYLAPLQLKANNGIFIIDDMGRQKVPPKEIFNRWIVPMEEKTDYLALGAGRHFSVPFDQVLIFSTNMNPLDLADEAFLRRIGYKIEFPTLNPNEYAQIWQDFCAQHGILSDDDVLSYAIDVLHAESNTPLLPCHPRDLLGMSVDQTRYRGQPRRVTREHLTKAWNTYFVSVHQPTNSREVVSHV